MAKMLRVEHEGAFYHIMSRGNRREMIFMDDGDPNCFLTTLEGARERTGWRPHSYVLMGNHYHWLLATPLKAEFAPVLERLGSAIKCLQRGHLYQNQCVFAHVCNYQPQVFGGIQQVLKHTRKCYAIERLEIEDCVCV